MMSFSRLVSSDALQTDIAEPIGMQDYDKKRQKENSGMPYTVHPEYAMYLSTRDMARIGLLMLRGGEWNGKRIMPEHWAEARWWIWDLPKMPAGISASDFIGAFAAWGTGGQ